MDVNDTPIYFECVLRMIRESIWGTAYAQGAEDERKAIEWDITEYPHAARNNPYRRD